MLLMITAALLLPRLGTEQAPEQLLQPATSSVPAPF
jgi:hypothetical protein